METQASRLRIIALFEELSDAELAAIARSCTTRVYKRHAEISEVNDRTGDVFFILEGAVRANTVSADGREVIYTDLGVGDIVGEFSAIDHQPRSSGMVATSDCLLARMTADKFDALSADRPYRQGLARDRVCDVLTADAGFDLCHDCVAAMKDVAGV